MYEQTTHLIAAPDTVGTVLTQTLKLLRKSAREAGVDTQAVLNNAGIAGAVFTELLDYEKVKLHQGPTD
jgi:hypothetical protein